MNRAKTEQVRHTPWFAKAGAASSIVPISRFVGPHIFALKGGGYGRLFSLVGLDEEGLADQELEARVRQIEGALRGLPEGSCLYQYTRVMSGFDLPRQKRYANEITEAFASDRLAFLNKNAAFRRIDLHWCLTLEPSQVHAFERKPKDNAIETSRTLAELEKTATLLEGHLGSSLGLRLLGKSDAFQFFSYLFNLEEWAGHDQLRCDTGVDRRIVKSPVAWHSDHVQVGQRHVQMFSLKTTPEASRPCLFSGLLSLDCDSVLSTTWRVKSASAARSEIDAQEKFISFFKVGVLTRVMNGRDTASLEAGAGAKAANNSVEDLSEVIRSLDKKAQGEFSLRLLLAARSPQQLRDVVPAVHRTFVDARAQLPGETQALWALLGMGAMLSGALGVPLTAILFSLELTHALPALLPLVLACTSAYLVTALVMPRSILTEKLSRRGFHLSREYGVDPLEMVTVVEVMTKISDADPIREERAPLPEILAYSDETCRAVAEEMATSGVMSMPVADRETGRICGLISAQELLTGRRRAVVRESERNSSFQLEARKAG